MDKDFVEFINRFSNKPIDADDPFMEPASRLAYLQILDRLEITSIKTFLEEIEITFRLSMPAPAADLWIGRFFDSIQSEFTLRQENELSFLRESYGLLSSN